MRISDWSSDVCSSDLMRRVAPDWLDGCALRECWFEPTFHKHHGNLCNSLMIHAEGPFYDHHAFRPWRLQALAFKAVRNLLPDYPIWRDFPYEYEFDRLAIDVINGGRSEEHTSELQSLMRISYAVFCLKK